MAAQGKGGAVSWMWMAIGAVVGLGADWYLGDWFLFTVLGITFGSLVGLSLQDAGTGADAH